MSKNIENPETEAVDIDRLVRCDFCGGLGSIAYNPNLNPNAFHAATSAPCRRCEGMGYTEPSWNLPGSTKGHDCTGTGNSDSENNILADDGSATHDTEHRDNIVCPHCGYEDRDSWEVDFGPGLEGEIEHQCAHCDLTMKAERCCTVTYTTAKSHNGKVSDGI